jgi:hypothetical protein
MKCLTFRLAGRIKKSRRAIIVNEIVGKELKDALPAGIQHPDAIKPLYLEHIGALGGLWYIPRKCSPTERSGH